MVKIARSYSFNRFLRYWSLKGRKSPILRTVALKTGSGVTQGHWFWYHWKARVYVPISD